ncbi:C-X-C chemokine receptor type 3.1 [Hippocampus zosterae]|uniref:C-X-C chemokine receptor type 3.1 n=1 Tax=Hippocampus zosterae TaxID=109293 RepID=UPI00223DF898|nr:C-X-C chemokine receptor type 3.1 [Hippocampus zosterae]
MSYDFSLSSLLESGQSVTLDGNSTLLDGVLFGYDNESDESYDGNETLIGVCDPNEGQHFQAVFSPVLYSVAFLVGILGNGLLLGILTRSRKTWSVTDTFILHLAVADVLQLLTLPLWAAQDGQSLGWTFGTPLCKIAGAVFTINCYCGIFLLACISLDRYVSIVHATQVYSRRKPWIIQSSCLAVWLLSLLLAVPNLIFLEAVENTRRRKTQCVANFASWELASRLLCHIVGFLLPSLVLVFCYSCILRRLRCGAGGVQKQKAFRVIAAVVAVFFLCWTPYNVTLMVETSFLGNNRTSCEFRASLQKAMSITPIVGNLHCSLNPILYAFVGVKFRRQLLDILRLLTCKSETGTKFQSVSGRRTSIWSESTETSNSLAI